jgi:hypothetical protein
MIPEKRAFVKKLAHGIRDLLEYMNIQLDIEPSIRKQIFTQNEFSVGKFRMVLDTVHSEILESLLKQFDRIGITIDRAFTMASPDPLFFTQDDRDFVKRINDGDIKTFCHFLIY